jgi:hypothetical protein
MIKIQKEKLKLLKKAIEGTTNKIMTAGGSKIQTIIRLLTDKITVDKILVDMTKDKILDNNKMVEDKLEDQTATDMRTDKMADKIED